MAFVQANQSMTSPSKLVPESWNYQKDGYPESWDEPPEKLDGIGSRKHGYAWNPLESWGSGWLLPPGS